MASNYNCNDSSKLYVLSIACHDLRVPADLTTLLAVTSPSVVIQTAELLTKGDLAAH